jgi:hypothetical protein
MGTDAYAKATFSINESGNVFRSDLLLRPSLLIVRTGRIVTAHVTTLSTGCDTNEYRRMLGCSST